MESSLPRVSGWNTVSAVDRVISRTNKAEWIGIARLLPSGLIQRLQWRISCSVEAERGKGRMLRQSSFRSQKLEIVYPSGLAISLVLVR